MAGFLEKKGGVRKNWLRRWFVIDGSVLRYFTKPDGELKGSVKLDDVIEVRVSQCADASPHELEILAVGRTYRMRASNEDECRAWVAALQTATAVPTNSS